jgi:hypothetical protein
MLGGLCTMGLAVVAWTVCFWVRKLGPIRSNRQVLALVGLVALCGVAALVNPYGVRLLAVWFYLSGPSVLPQYILEHMPLDPRDFGGRCVLVLALLYLLALVGTLPRWPRATWLIPLVWFVLACRSIRHGPLFAVVAGMSLADILPHTRWARWLAAQETYLYRPSPSDAAGSGSWRPLVAPTAVVVVALLLQIDRLPVPLVGHDWARLDRSYWPVQTLPELQALPDGTPVFNDMLFGGFLIRYAPNARVYVDDRCELYGDAFLRDYFEAQRDHPQQINAWARQYDFDWALVEPESGFNTYLGASGDWTTVCKTDGGVLYRRKTHHRTP